MGMLRRALISVKGNQGKSIILTLLVFLLGVLISGTLVVRNAVDQTESLLWSRTPAIASIGFDFYTAMEYENEGEISVFEIGLDPEVIRQIGRLPYVANFDYGFNHILWSDEFELYADHLPPGLWNLTGETLPFRVRGVYNREVLDLQEGVIQLVSGSTFEEVRVLDGGYPALVSQELATLNDLSVGSTFILESRVFYDSDEAHNNNDFLNLDNTIESESFELEVVGIFEISGEVNTGSESEEVGHFDRFFRYDLINQIYTPIGFVEATPSFNYELEAGLSLDTNQMSSYFLLYDPMDMTDFVESANDMLSGGWRIDNLSGNFSRLSASMDSIQWLADVILWGGLSASLVVLTLIMILCLYDRRYEMGIYLALGESKVRLIGQLLVEQLLMTLPSLTLSIFVGNLFSTYFSRVMLEQDLIRQLANDENLFFVNHNLIWQNPGVMTIEEMMTSFDVTLNGFTIAMILGLSLSVVLGTTFIASYYIVKLSPKKVLM